MRRAPSDRLTPREREVSRLIAQGLTNKEIAARLRISERTVGAHVQNTFNKLNVQNRAQVATWWATSGASPKPDAVAPIATYPRSRNWFEVHLSRALVAVAFSLMAVLLIASTDAAVPRRAPNRPPEVQQLIYEAKLAGDGDGFGARYVIGDATASAIRFRPGAVEFAVVKPDGNTGDHVGVAPLSRYYIELELTVMPASNVEFWLDLDSNGYITNIGDHLVDFETAAELMQLQYFGSGVGGQPLGPQVPVHGMQAGRKFLLGAMAAPPLYQVYLDGVRVITLQHSPSALALSPSFAIFGQGGTVVLTSLRVYQVGEPATP
jgi:DNA-binding CsgD family transcriptional regulator